MAEFTIVLIPEEKQFVPTQEAIEAAKSLMEEYFPDRGNEVNSELSNTPRFISSHDSFEEISCPECGEEINRFDLDEDDDGETWWDRFEQKLDDAKDATTVKLKMPCCDAKVKVTDLDFGQNAGFARFELSVRDPGDDTEVTDEQKSNLESTLGCKLMQITRVNS